MVEDNRAALGAGVYDLDGNLTVTSSLITGNLGQASHVSEGGGVYLSSSSSRKSHKLTIDGSTIDSNSATFGGGVLLSASGPPIKLSATISDSTISNNTSATNAFGPGSGAGLDIGFAKLTMTNSTISGNNASGTTGAGGAIQTFAAAVALNNVTIANNSAGSIGGGINANINDQSFVISNTIIANNNAPASVDCEGPITSNDYNFIGDPSGCTLSNKTAHNLNGDPMLGFLKNNGGATDTQALLPGSPALGAGNPGIPNGKSGHCAASDQIGTARSKGDCDIGAYQLPD